MVRHSVLVGLKDTSNCFDHVCICSSSVFNKQAEVSRGGHWLQKFIWPGPTYLTILTRSSRTFPLPILSQSLPSSSIFPRFSPRFTYNHCTVRGFEILSLCETGYKCRKLYIINPTTADEAPFHSPRNKCLPHWMVLIRFRCYNGWAVAEDCHD